MTLEQCLAVAPLVVLLLLWLVMWIPLFGGPPRARQKRPEPAPESPQPYDLFADPSYRRAGAHLAVELVNAQAPAAFRAAVTSKALEGIAAVDGSPPIEAGSYIVTVDISIVRKPKAVYR